ncbi:hypothetical protein BN903_45 [Halorubrum sp. AJ67]|nr:hypothetical protein BN903_45 [Halorubrum sp. AJ67]
MVFRRDPVRDTRAVFSTASKISETKDFNKARNQNVNFTLGLRSVSTTQDMGLVPHMGFWLVRISDPGHLSHGGSGSTHKDSLDSQGKPRNH